MKDQAKKEEIGNNVKKLIIRMRKMSEQEKKKDAS